MHLRLAPLLLLAPTLPGCLLLLGSAQPSCPNEGMTSTSDVTWAGAERTATLDPVSLDADPTGSCITNVSGTIEFGMSCALSFQAEGGGDTLVIFDVTTWGEEDCGLPDDGWSVADLGDSHVDVDGDLTNIGGDDSSCFDGALTITLDVLLESSDDTAHIDGTLELDGVDLAWFDERPCD